MKFTTNLARAATHPCPRLSPVNGDKAMSKTIDTKLGRATQNRELRDDELDVVSGGKVEANVQQKATVRQVEALLNQW